MRETLERRAKAAARLSKLLEGITNSLEKIPSYTGKARFMDKVIKVRRNAELLAINLKGDVSALQKIR